MKYGASCVRPCLGQALLLNAAVHGCQACADDTLRHYVRGAYSMPCAHSSSLRLWNLHSTIIVL
jgi:hypothetical protein